jgi:hypothetical protein
LRGQLENLLTGQYSAGCFGGLKTRSFGYKNLIIFLYNIYKIMTEQSCFLKSYII